MKKFFTLIAVAMVAICASAQDFGTLSVVGNKVIAGSDKDWDEAFTGSEMTNNGDGTYTFTKENATLEAGTEYQFKIIQNHDWNNLNWGGDADGDGKAELGDNGLPINNAAITVSETAVYTVTITLTPDESMLNVPKVTTTKTGEAGNITHVYTVAGSFLKVDGANWQSSNPEGEMTLDTDPDSETFGYYTWTGKNIAIEGEANFKITVDGGWGTSYPAGNYTIEGIDGDGNYDIFITFDESSKAITATATKADVTAIQTVATVKVDTEAPMFNLAGQRVNKNYRGVVLQGGRKFIQK